MPDQSGGTVIGMPAFTGRPLTSRDAIAVVVVVGARVRAMPLF